MKSQFTNKVLSSTLLWLDNKLCTQGQAFFNVSGGLFYGTQNLFNGYTTYASQYSNFIADSSIPGAIIMTGVYLNGNFITTGQSGLANIDYNKGRLYFSTGVPNSTISGTFSTRELDVKIKPDANETILFETKHYLKPMITQSQTGLNTDEALFPIIYVGEQAGRNMPFQMGGTDLSEYNLQCVILSDSQFQLDAIKSIIRDQRYSYIPILAEGEFPFNAYGGLLSGFNYSGIASGKNGQNIGYIQDSYVSQLGSRVQAEVNNYLPNAYVAIANLNVEVVRNPRQGG